jgi:hypothetical protein
MGLGEGRGWDVVGLSPIDEDAFVAIDDRVAGDADYTFGEVEIARVRIGRDGAAKIDAGVNDDHFASLRIAKVVREALGEVAAVAGRDRWDVACPRLGQNRDYEVR